MTTRPAGLSRGVPASGLRSWPWHAYYATLGTWRRTSTRRRDSIVVNGAPRSGTTWLGDIVVDVSGWPVLHEPTHPTRIPELMDLVGWDGRPYRDPGEDDPELEAVLEPLLTGTYLGANLLAGGHAARSPSGGVDSIVTKNITLNLLLPWMAQQMPWLRTVQVVRHPLAVVASQQGRAESYWASTTTLSRPYHRFMDAHPEYRAPTEHATVAEALVTMWAIEHAWLRDTAELTREAPWLRYEELRADPDAHAHRIAAWAGWDPPSAATRARLRRPSRSVERASTTIEADSPHSEWRQRYGVDERARLSAILGRFGFPFYGPETLEVDG